LTIKFNSACVQLDSCGSKRKMLGIFLFSICLWGATIDSCGHIVHGSCKIVIRISDYYWAKDGTMKKAATTQTDRVTMHYSIYLLYNNNVIFHPCLCMYVWNANRYSWINLCMCVHVRRRSWDKLQNILRAWMIML